MFVAEVFRIVHRLWRCRDELPKQGLGLTLQTILFIPPLVDGFGRYGVPLFHVVLFTRNTRVT